MNNPEPQPSDYRNRVLALAPLADLASKSLAAITIAVYACGFLAVSLHHSSYGFVGTTLFRPHTVAAGAWFLFFFGIPLSVAFGWRESTWTSLGKGAFVFWSFGFGLAYLFGLLFSFEYIPSSSSQTKWWVLIPQLILFAVALFFMNRKQTPARIVALISVAVVLYIVVTQIKNMVWDHNFDHGSLALWFFGVFAVAVVDLKLRLKDVLKDGEWWKPLSTIFVALLVFAQYYYPHMKASWGGGTPVNVTIYFSKDSPIKSNQCVTAQLVEESDEGFYIVSPKESRAIYVPRTAVSLIYFSDRLSDSALLRDKQP